MNNDIKFQNKKLDWDTPMLIKLSNCTENLYGACGGGNGDAQNCGAGTGPSSGSGGPGSCKIGQIASSNCSEGLAIV